MGWRTKWFWLWGTFPLSCPLSSYLQLLEVLLLHLLLCYNVRLVLNLVYLLRGAVRLNLRHYPGDRRLESHNHNLRGKLRCYLQLLASRQTFLSVGKPACQQATLLCLAGRVSAQRKRTENPAEWKVMTDKLLLAATLIKRDHRIKQTEATSDGKYAKRQWLPFIVFKITIDCLFKFGGSDQSWRPEARVGVKNWKKVKNWTAQAQGWEELRSQESDCSTPPSLLQRNNVSPCKTTTRYLVLCTHKYTFKETWGKVWPNLNV